MLSRQLTLFSIIRAIFYVVSLLTLSLVIPQPAPWFFPEKGVRAVMSVVSVK